MTLKLDPTNDATPPLQRPAPARPLFRALSPAECRIVLARNSFGRLAHTLYDHVGIEPLHYIYRDNALWGRTAPGMKTRVVERNPRVAFEVDEVDAMFHWRSVVARGEFEMLSAVGAEDRLRDWHRGLAIIRELMPETFTDQDPVPFRTILFRIVITTATGVEARQG